MQYQKESHAFDRLFANLKHNRGYLTRSVFIEKALDWCTQTGYTYTEIISRLKTLELDRDYLTNVLGLTMEPERKARERTHMAAYILNTLRIHQGQKALKIPHSGYIELEFDSDGDLSWERFDTVMNSMRAQNDVWHLLKKLGSDKSALVDVVDAENNPSPPMREILKKRIEK